MARRDPFRRGVLRQHAPCRRRSAGTRGRVCRSGVPAVRRWAQRSGGSCRRGRRGRLLATGLLGVDARPSGRPGRRSPRSPRAPGGAPWPRPTCRSMAERFNSRLASPSSVESVICRKRPVSTFSTMRSLMTSSVRLRAYMSRIIVSSWLAGKTSPRTLNTLPVRCGSRSSSIGLMRSKSFCRTRPSRVLVDDEVEDEAVLLLAVAVDAAHALLQPHRVPGDVVVDHQPAELQVDAFARGLGGHQHLGLRRGTPARHRCACRACRGRRSSCRRGSA